MKLDKTEDLKVKACEIRKDVVRSLGIAGSGHLGGSLSTADIFTALYFNVLNHNPQNPSWPERDRLILSIGHVAPVYYTALAHAGYFPKDELKTLRKLGSRLQGHPGREHGLPGIELSAGSLGQGLSVAVGRAIAGKADNRSWTVFCINGDGELQEGSIWEAAMSAGHYKLDNLVVIVDRNRVQIDGKTETVMRIEPLADKWKAFNWNVIECNGHNFDELIPALNKARDFKGKPSVVIANTIMGKGIPEIEGDYTWHGKPPKPGQVDEFLRIIDKNG
ncbi:MAG: transketolase [Bacteroidales bacterium]|nr:transketolase [Bacteroidales bacterium]